MKTQFSVKEKQLSVYHLACKLQAAQTNNTLFPSLTLSCTSYKNIWLKDEENSAASLPLSFSL